LIIIKGIARSGVLGFKRQTLNKRILMVDFSQQAPAALSGAEVTSVPIMLNYISRFSNTNIFVIGTNELHTCLHTTSAPVGGLAIKGKATVRYRFRLK
jgi:hypothetical protein